MKRMIVVALLLIAPKLSAGPCTITICNNAPCPAKLAYLEFACPETSWRVFVRNTLKGLRVGPAELRRSTTSYPMQVLYSASVAEIYVPYHPGNDRLSDVQFCDLSPGCLRAVDANDVGANGQLVTMGGDPFPTAVAEIRDRGIAWMCKWHDVNGDHSKSRRGQEMVVWGTWDPGNYDYVIAYTFRDDGQMSFRIGATGWNNSQIGEDVAHMHTTLWRVDMDLNGSFNDNPFVEVHLEPGGTNPLEAVDMKLPFFFFGGEGPMDLEPLRFSSLVIEDTGTTNAAGNHISYELLPFGSGGIARHFAGNEQWTQHDTWITRYHADEDDAALSIPHYYGADEYLAGANSSWGIANEEPVMGQDIVLWHLSAAHHEPHDEDQAAQDATHGHQGLTLMHWSGFDLVPRNLFDFNPLGSPHRGDCDWKP